MMFSESEVVVWGTLVGVCRCWFVLTGSRSAAAAACVRVWMRYYSFPAHRAVWVIPSVPRYIGRCVR